MISIFDSGIGGISILREIRAALPDAPLFYFGDTAYMPYGSRTPEEIYERINKFIETEDAQTDMYVIACNTATVSLIADYRKLSKKPFVGVEPGIKPAVAASRTHHVAVLATPRTIVSKQLQNLIARFGADTQFTLVACDGLAEAIERTPEKIDALLAHYVSPLPKTVDTILLACTHYPLIADRIQQFAGSNRTLIDVSPAVARHTGQLYTKIAHTLPETPRITYACSGNRAEFLQHIQAIAPELR